MSFADMIEEVESESNTITVFNYRGDDEVIDKISEEFEVHNVNVKVAETDPNQPKDFAVLHNGNRFIEAAGVDELRKAILMEDWDEYASRTEEETELPHLLTKLENTHFTAHGVSRRLLMNASRHIEERAWKQGNGVLRTGFQKLSKMRDNKGTWDIYSRIAQSGVDVHVYGVPDWQPPKTEDINIHGIENDEIERTHFVFFDGGGNEKKKGALIAEERESESDDEKVGYHGFWTYEPEKVDRIGEYIAETYG